MAEVVARATPITRLLARPQGARHPDGRATTSGTLRPGGGHARELNSDYPAPASSPPGSAGARGLAGVRVEHVESRGVGDAPEIGSTLSVRRVRVARRARARGRRRAARPRPVSNGEDELVDTPSSRLTSPRPTRAAGTGSTATSGSTSRARSATPSGWCRRTPLLASPAELAHRLVVAAGLTPSRSRRPREHHHACARRGSASSPAWTGVPGRSGSVESTTSPCCTHSFSGSVTSTGVGAGVEPDHERRVEQLLAARAGGAQRVAGDEHPDDAQVVVVPVVVGHLAAGGVQPGQVLRAAARSSAGPRTSAAAAAPGARAAAAARSW